MTTTEGTTMPNKLVKRTTVEEYIEDDAPDETDDDGAGIEAALADLPDDEDDERGRPSHKHPRARER